MNIKKFFEYFKSEASIEDVMDIFNDISDEYDVDIEFKEELVSPFFPSYPNGYFLRWRPEIGRYEFISKIIEVKTSELISPKFIESYMSDYYNYSSSSKEIKDYHKQFSGSERYPSDIKLIRKYESSHFYTIFIKFKYSESDLIKIDFDPIFQRLKSIYNLDKIYFHKNAILRNGELITTIMVV